MSIHHDITEYAMVFDIAFPNMFFNKIQNHFVICKPTSYLNSLPMLACCASLMENFP